MRYSEKVDKLLELGVFEYGKWPDYLALGFSSQDIPALLRLVQDEEVLCEEDEPIASAPFHGWRVLALLQAESAVQPLLAALDSDDDWTNEEGAQLFGVFGEVAIAPLQAYLTNPQGDEYLQLIVAEAFAKIAQYHLRCKVQCEQALVTCLKQITTPDSILAGYIINSLIELDAKQAIDTIKAAFKNGTVDTSVTGEFGDVKDALGLD